MDTLRNIGEIGLGLLFGVGAIFNIAYTLRNGDTFYRTWADGAWLPGARQAIERLVIPNATLVTMVVILVQVAVAAMILLRGDLVRLGLFAGAGFALLAAAASSPGGTTGNLGLAAVQVLLALAR